MAQSHDGPRPPSVPLREVPTTGHVARSRRLVHWSTAAGAMGVSTLPCPKYERDRGTIGLREPRTAGPRSGTAAGLDGDSGSRAPDLCALPAMQFAVGQDCPLDQRASVG